jgi:hypothetical protein
MKLRRSIFRLTAIVVFLMMILNACGSGKGCDCPSFGLAQNLERTDA